MKKVLAKLNRIINEFTEEGLIAEGMALDLVFKKVAQAEFGGGYSDDDVNSWSDNDINDEINDQGRIIQNHMRYLERYKSELERLLPAKQKIIELEQWIKDSEKALADAEALTNKLYEVLEARPSQKR